MKKIMLSFVATFALTFFSNTFPSILDNPGILHLGDAAAIVLTEAAAHNGTITNEHFLNTLRIIENLSTFQLLLLLLSLKEENLLSPQDTLAKTSGVVSKALFLITLFSIKKLSQTNRGKKILTNLGWQYVIEHSSLATLNGVKAVQNTIAGSAMVLNEIMRI